MATLKPLQTKHWLALLAALSVIVLIAHLLALEAARGQLSINKSIQTTALTTRMIELTATEPVPQKTPDIVTPQKPTPKIFKPRPKPQPKPVSTAEPKPEPEIRPIPVETAAAAAPAVAPVAPIAPAPPTPQVQPTSVETPPTAPEVATPVPEPTLNPSMATSGEARLPVPAFTALSSGQHNYKVYFALKGVTNQGKAEVKWQHDGEKYALNLTATVLFADAFIWKSTGSLSPDGLLPERFSDKRYRKSEVAAHFDQVLKKITFSANTPEAELRPGAQDRISVIWKLAGLLTAEPARYPPGTNISIQVADATEAEIWVFTINEPENLNLGNGPQIALRLTRNPRREFDRKIELWFAPSMGYLPVRFRQTQTSGDYEDMVWQSTQALPNAPIK